MGLFTGGLVSGTLAINGQLVLNGQVLKSIDKNTIGLSSVNNWAATSATNDSSTSKYATAAGVKAAYDLAASKMTQETADGLYLAKTGKAADSERLDNLGSTQFLRSDVDDSFSGGLISTSRNSGLFGTYDSNKTDQIWSMGTAYRNSSAGSSFGNLFGLAYKHTNNPTGGEMAGGHQVVWCVNGTPSAAMGEHGIWTSGYMNASVGNIDTLTSTTANLATINSTTINVDTLSLKPGATDLAYIRSAKSDSSTYMDFCLGDDPSGNDQFRWMFQCHGGDSQRVNMSLYPTESGANKARLNLYGEMYAVDGTKRVYHQGFKPTAAEVGALPLGGGTVTGRLVLNGYDPLELNRSSGWSYMTLHSGGQEAHIGQVNSAQEGAVAHSLHLRPRGIGDGSLIIQPNLPFIHKTSYGNVKIGAQNVNYLHYETDRPNHWFNIDVRVNGEIYAGPDYDKRVYHQGFKPTAAEVGAMPSNGMFGNQKVITVGGDADKYYPVAIRTGVSQGAQCRVQIYRNYNTSGPNWYTANHKGGGCLDVTINNGGGWGGVIYNMVVHNVWNTYATVMSDAVVSSTGRYFIVWLRGGGATWYVASDSGSAVIAEVHLEGFTDDKVNYPVKTTSDNSNILTRWTTRNSGAVYDNNHRVYSPANKPSADDLGVLPKGHWNISNQDLTVHGKRALVGMTNGSLYLNYDGDFSNTYIKGTVHIDRELNADGGIVINNSAPTIRLQDTDNRTGFIHMNANRFYILRSASNNGMSWDSGPNGYPMILDVNSGAVTFAGNVTGFSDRTMKKNIERIDNPLGRIAMLNGVTFNWRGESAEKCRQAGLIAQDVQLALPEAVTVDDNGKLKVAHAQLSGLYVEAINALAKENQELREMLDKVMKHLNL